MNEGYSRSKNDERKEDNPPFSRLFVVCSKLLTNNDLDKAFRNYGEIENLYMPYDRATGASKGIAFIKYYKTSHAAQAMKDMHGQTMGPDHKSIKVLLASNKEDNDHIKEENIKRLFIVCCKTSTESELNEIFSSYGEVDSVFLIKDKVTAENRGLAFINFKDFLGAAQAYDQCDKKFKAVFAKPHIDLKRSRTIAESGTATNIGSSNYNKVQVVCSPRLSQQHIEKLFNIVPGMETVTYGVDNYAGFGKGIVTYKSSEFAAHAVEKLNDLEYPLGERLTVTPDYNVLSKLAKNLSSMVQSFSDVMSSGRSLKSDDLMILADAMSQASTMIKCATDGSTSEHTPGHDYQYCNVKLPPPLPLADKDSSVAKRCYVVYKPSPPPMHILSDVFSRFGDLIHIYTSPHKPFGYVKYASESAAHEAIKVLNGATVDGVILKVMEAQDVRRDCSSDDERCKRLKLDKNDK